MAYESRFDKAERMIYLRYWDNLTAEEFRASLDSEREFFEGMTGPVGVVVDVTALKGLPPSILTHARNTHLARYKNVIVALVGASGFVTAIGQMFGKLTSIPVSNFADDAAAEAHVREQITRHSAG